MWAAEKAKSRVESEWQQSQPIMQELKFRSGFLTLRAWLWAFATVRSLTHFFLAMITRLLFYCLYAALQPCCKISIFVP